ncbi:MAG: aminopeptidase N C-terminal domain-containing protein, partial [Xanthobacteraceae bacterium]
SGAAPTSADGLFHALAAILADERLEPAFVAQTLTLPGDSDIAREIGHDIDPDAIFNARKILRAAIGRRLTAKLSETYGRMTDRGPYSPDAQSAGRRSLKNACLDLLAAGAEADWIGRAFRQYENADNMTDRMAALSILSLHDVAQRAAAIDDFYRRYAADPLILDKWFALQAAMPDPKTLDRVKTLIAHPAFSFANPNRVRALIGTFAHGNPTQFNRADGKGYEFVAERILALDERNPQVAARLLAAFKSWRMLEAERRAHAQATLRRVAAAGGLSRDVTDIVERALAESTELVGANRHNSL